MYYPVGWFAGGVLGGIDLVGMIKDVIIEIQGEQRERILEVLRKLGNKVKIAGG